MGNLETLAALHTQDTKRRQTKQKHKNTTQKTNKKSYMDPTQNTTQKTKKMSYMDPTRNGSEFMVFNKYHINNNLYHFREVSAS